MAQSGVIKPSPLTKNEIDDNFADIAPPLSKKQVMVASERCLFCHDAPCINACPTEIDIPLFIRKLNTGNTFGAAKTILSANILGGSCARVCPAETLCEQACVRNRLEGEPVNISGLQRYAIDQLAPDSEYPFKRSACSTKHVAVVGAGPAGLACAHRLAQNGHRVTIYEAAAKSGGLNEYGIAKYKLVDDYAQQEVAFVLKIGGIDIKYQTALGRDVSLTELRYSHDAVFIGVGLSYSRCLNIPGENLPGVQDAEGYIRELRQSSNMAELPLGQKIVVIGGGMTAIDIAVQAKKLGAEQVTLVYRRDRSVMGASSHEQKLALNMGVNFIFNAVPSAIIGNEKGLSSAIFTKTSAEIQGNIRSAAQSFQLPCDQVFKAIGQKLDKTVFDELSTQATAIKPRIDNYGRIAVNDKFETSINGVFAGGDCIKGDNLVVEAVAQGNKAAIAIDLFLNSAPKSSPLAESRSHRRD
ncbi:NAD(P)-dependent oxidoreductase [Thalassomonas viridans]|uniref:NAD(P)-dependent oxidoreductase n=1 Tax=Thalassomonas viridans TaxID=137584 RepID=A0AAE9Z9M5_9GAMM|nr:NAD(P)-dependent oxidoreductase [Thalassomonas viridans]WDE08585.1 NAD(P)-dependent oxidoreductase [Thalassomonas viridans]